ncbi:MAG: hypothetical protein AAF720_13935 [Pseudomonadota bacterium]
MRKTSQRFDLAILGADVAGLAAAGCAAVEGASVLLVKTGAEAPLDFAGPGIPNAVWRLLGLEKVTTDRPKIAKTKTLTPLKDNKIKEVFELHATRNDVIQSLKSICPDTAERWADFEGELSSLTVSPASLLHSHQHTLYGSTLDTLNEYLDDCFDHEPLKTHLAAQSLLALGLAGDEPGSAGALAALSKHAWPTNYGQNGHSFFDDFEKAVLETGVVLAQGGVEEVASTKPHSFDIKLRPGDTFTTKAVMASGVGVARASGFFANTARSPLSRYSGSSAFIRIKFDDYPETDILKDDERIFILENRQELAAARDAMAEGRIPENLPLTVEVNQRTMTAFTSFCPDQLIDDDGSRPWSDQDRQALGRLVYDRIKEHLNIRGRPSSIDVRIDISPHEPDPTNDKINRQNENRLRTPIDVADPVMAAVQMALEMTGHD